MDVCSFVWKVISLGLFEGIVVLGTLLVNVNSHTCTEQKHLYVYINMSVHAYMRIMTLEFLHTYT